jgi:hypothetical protein
MDACHVRMLNFYIIQLVLILVLLKVLGQIPNNQDVMLVIPLALPVPIV